MKYEVVRATRDEIELQFDSEPGRVVLARSGKDEIHAPDLVDFAGGTVWRRAGTPGAGLP